jgi:hypothetical protein
MTKISRSRKPLPVGEEKEVRLPLTEEEEEKEIIKMLDAHVPVPKSHMICIATRTKFQKSTKN